MNPPPPRSDAQSSIAFRRVVSHCIMGNATHGLLVTCDIPVKEFLLWLDESQPRKFIVFDLDATHLFVKNDAMEFLQEELNKLYEENQYSFIQ